MYRYIPRESCSQFDSLPLTSLTTTSAGIVAPQAEFLPGIIHHLLPATIETKWHPSINDEAVKAKVRVSAAYTLERIVRMSKHPHERQQNPFMFEVAASAQRCPILVRVFMVDATLRYYYIPVHSWMTIKDVNEMMAKHVGFRLGVGTMFGVHEEVLQRENSADEHRRHLRQRVLADEVLVCDVLSEWQIAFDSAKEEGIKPRLREEPRFVFKVRHFVSPETCMKAVWWTYRNAVDDFRWNRWKHATMEDVTKVCIRDVAAVLFSLVCFLRFISVCASAADRTSLTPTPPSAAP